MIKQYWAEIEKFHRHMHEKVAYKVLQLLAIILEMPEDALVGGHLYKANCDSSLRYMMYGARSQVDNDKYRDHYLRGYTDNVFQQPVAALQVKQTEDSDWEYIRIPPGTIAVNIADGYLVRSVMASERRPIQVFITSFALIALWNAAWEKSLMP